MRNFQPNIYAVEPVFMQNLLETLADADISKLESRLTFSEILDGKREPITSTSNGVATIRVTGFLSIEGPSIFEKLFGFDGTAYIDIQEAVRAAAADESVTRIVLAVDSPGGTVVGADETFQAIAAANAIKEVESVNIGIMASAAYYISAAAGKITATSPQNETGSIGVIIAGFDTSEALENRGIKRVVIVSENAPNKDQSLQGGAGEDALQARVDAAERIFIQRVAEGRGISIEQVKNTFGRGTVMVAKDPAQATPDALSVGMIDAVLGVSEEAINSDISSNTIQAEVKPPAQIEAGNNQEVLTMKTLKELMAENPTAQAELDRLIADAKAGGFKAGKEEADTEAKARAEAAAPFLKADSGYGASIRGLAAKVATGEASVDALTSAVAAVDEMKEVAASEALGGEGGEGGEETPPNANGQGAQPKADGSVDSEEEFEALMNAEKGADA